MSDPSDDGAAAGPVLNADQRSPVPRVELNDVECRVLGSLIEKEFLTPDVYPMTTNALVAACNQKTNRDPVVDYGAVLVDATLLELRQRQLVRRVHMSGSRATKHRQAIGEILALDPGELALLSVLMLRGPQTVGELRLRTERHHGFEDLEATEAALERLAARPLPLVEQLERRPGHKEARWQHLLGDPAAAATVRAPAYAARFDGEDDRDAAPSGRSDVPEPSTGGQTSRAAALSARVDALENEVAALREHLRRFADQLGEPLD